MNYKISISFLILFISLLREIIFESVDPTYMWDGTYKGKLIQDGLYTYKINYSSEFSKSEVVVGHVSVLR